MVDLFYIMFTDGGLLPDGMIITAILLLVRNCDGAQLNSYSACYGTTNQNFIFASCNAGEKIVMESVFVYAKPVASGCPNIMTRLNVTYSCCQYEEGDCGKKYEGEKHREYYQNCDGKTTCIKTPVSWEGTPTCGSMSFLDKTNYMVANFYCVPENDIQTVSGNSSTTDAEVFLWNTGYPSGSMTKSSSYTCSVAASCATQLRVRALNLMLTSNAGSCSQSLTIKDGGNTTVVDCNSNTDLIPVYIYDSGSYYLETQANNTLPNDAGKFFLLVTAMNSFANLTLACGSSKGRGFIKQSDIPPCPSPATTTTVQTTPPAPTPSSTNQPTTYGANTGTGTGSDANAGKNSGEEDQSSSYTVIVIVVVIVLILLILLFILLFHRDKIKECCCRDKNQEPDEKSLSSQFENPLLVGFMPTGKQIAPRSTFKTNNVAPEPLTPENKLPPIVAVSDGNVYNDTESNGEDQEDSNGLPVKPRRLPPLAVFQAQQAFQDNLREVKRREKRVKKMEKALKRRESELQEKAAVVNARERILEKRLSSLGQGSNLGPNVPQQDGVPAPPRPVQRWSSILPSSSDNKLTSFGAVASVVTAFRPKPSDSVCIDVTNADDGQLVSTHMKEEKC